MKRINCRTMLLNSIFLFIGTSVYAATPLWTFSTPTPKQVAIAPEGTATVEYIVTNQSTKAKNLVLWRR